MSMNRIVNHHTGGGYSPSSDDREHYHEIIDGQGRSHAGKFKISDNAPGRRLAAGTYAAHTAMLNTGSIGISAAAMRGGQWSSPRSCDYFPTREQMDALVHRNAELCVEYSIPVTRKTVLTHAEVEITLGVDQAAKWDFDYDPWGLINTRDPVVIGDKFRAKVMAAINRLGFDAVPEREEERRVLRRGAYGDDVREAQELLIEKGAKIHADRAFGPNTFAAVVSFQKSQELYPDGVIGRMTWSALLAE